MKYYLISQVNIAITIRVNNQAWHKVLLVNQMKDLFPFKKEKKSGKSEKYDLVFFLNLL